MIEKFKAENPEMNYIDCILEVFSENNIELEGIKGILSKNIKEKVEADAMELNLLKDVVKIQKLM